MGGTYRFTVGDFECFAVQDYEFVWSVAELCSEVPEDERRAAFIAAGLDPDSQEVGKGSCTCLAVNTGRQWVLIDAGYGRLAEIAGFGHFLANLATVGLQPADFSAVIVSHLHGDHYVGLCDENKNLLYPNAKVYIWEQEWQYYTSAEGGAQMAKQLPDEAENLRDFLPRLQPQLELVRQEGKLLPGFRLICAPGHTAHNVVISIESRGETALHIGDMVHHPLYVRYPHWRRSSDSHHEQAVETRRMMNQMAAERNCLVSACHFQFPGLGYIRSQGDMWEWENLDR